MHEIYELKEQLMKELEEYGRKGEMSAGSLEVVDKLAHTVKNLCKIIEDSEGDYSGARGRRSYEGQGGNMGGQSYRGGRSYEGRRSNARGRNARRDAMGRYSSEGYSYAADEMIDQLTDLMADAPEQVKSDIQRLISKVENM